VRVKAVKEAPKIDGEIDALYAQSATPLSFSFLDGTKGMPKEQTTCYALSDEENLYLAFRCEKADPDRVVCRKTKHDDDVWQDECIELFIDPKNTREKKYFHIIINSAGVTQDAHVNDTSWDPELTVKCGKEKGKAWIAEVKIPFKALGSKDEKIGHVWSINFNRSARSSDNPQACEDTAWSPTYGDSSHVPEMFGYMWLDTLSTGRDDTAFAAWAKSVGHSMEPAKIVDAAPKAEGGAVLAAISYNSPGAAGGELWILSAGDGSRAAVHKLPCAPAFDGMAIARGRVYLALQDGTIMCFGAK
jgi:hypothetical protein